MWYILISAFIYLSRTHVPERIAATFTEHVAGFVEKYNDARRVITKIIKAPKLIKYEKHSSCFSSDLLKLFLII